MSTVLKIGEQTIHTEDLFPLLAQYQMLPQLITEIITDQAIADIEYTPEEAALARKQFYQQYQLQSEEQVQAWLQQQSMTPEQLEHAILRGVKLEKFKQDKWENQLENYFLKRKGKLDQVIYSLIRSQDFGMIQELYFRAQENEGSFAEIAREYSQGPEAETSGLVGPVELSNPHPKVAQILKTSEPGEVLPPIQIDKWFIIVRLEKLIPAKLDQAMRQRLLNEKFRTWLNEQFQEQVSFVSNQTAQTEAEETDESACTEQSRSGGETLLADPNFAQEPV